MENGKVDTLVFAIVDGVVVDQNGAEVKCAPYHKKVLTEKGGCFKQTHGPRGMRFAHMDRKVFEDLRASAKPLTDTYNVKALDADVTSFVNASYSMKPDTLIMDELKWKYLMRSVVRGKNIMMTGPSGCGKTLAVQSVAKALDNRPYYYFNLGATTDARSALIGNTHFSTETGTFVADSLFSRAIQEENAIILLDELTRATPDAWNILMTVLDENQRYLRIDEKPNTPTVKVARGVTFIATANIGNEYTATRVLDRAMLDRFSAIVEMQPLSFQQETQLITMKYPELPAVLVQAIAEIATETRKQARSDSPRVSTTLSSRVTVEMAGLMYDGFSLAEAAEVCVFPFFSDAGGTDSERTYMKQLVQKYLGNVGEANPWTGETPALRSN
jgi:MoxR-like ATPase